MEYEYSRLGWRTPIVMVSVALTVALGLVAGVCNANFTESDYAANVPLALFVVVAALGLVASYLISIVAVCFWMHRACANAHVLARDAGWVAPTASPGYAAGCYFIPFVNLYQPYKVMKEIDTASSGVPSGDGTMIVWWATWILGNILGNMALRTDSAALDLARPLVHTVAGVALLLIVRRIHDLQAARRTELQKVPAGALDPVEPRWQG